MVKIDNMSILERVLLIANETSSNPYSKIDTRKQLRNIIIEILGDNGSINLTFSFDEGYIRHGKLWGFVLTKKGLNKLFELRDERGNK